MNATLPASHIEIGARYRFDYPAAFKTLPDYTAHAGQAVTVLRQLTKDEADQETMAMFEVEAGDGWRGHADEAELQPIADGDGIVFLTDRWGEVIVPERAEPMPAADALEALRQAMERADEDSFIVTRNGDLGLLVEIEYDDGAAPTDADHKAVAQIAAEHPECSVWISDDPGIFNGRYATRAFIPASMASAELAGTIQAAFSAFLY